MGQTATEKKPVEGGFYSDLHGTARFYEGELLTLNEAMDGNRIFFGDTFPRGNNYLSIVPDRHFLSIAPTRSGKGTSLIIPNLGLYKGSCIVIDPKGENAYITAVERRRKGQKVILLDPWNECNRRYGSKIKKGTAGLETVSRFNPLSILDKNSEHFADDVAYIADALVLSQGSDPHWSDSARELVAGLIAYVVYEHGELASLAMVRELLTKPPESIASIAKNAELWADDDDENLAARKLARFTTASKEMASVISTALTQTAFLDSKTLAANMQESDFSFSDLLEPNGATIYLILPVDKLYTYGRWLRLMVSIGIRTVARHTETLPLPVLFILDEFGTIGKLSAVSQAFGLMAGLNMCIWAFVQDLTQLKRDYPDEWETFIANSSAVSFFGVMDQFTAKYFSDFLGMATKEKLSDQTLQARGYAKMMNEKKGWWNSYAVKSAANQFALQAQQRGRVIQIKEDYFSSEDQILQRPLLFPDEVRRLPAEYGIVVSRFEPVYIKRVDYFNLPQLSVFLRQNPYYSRFNPPEVAAVPAPANDNKEPEQTQAKQEATAPPEVAAATAPANDNEKKESFFDKALYIFFIIILAPFFYIHELIIKPLIKLFKSAAAPDRSPAPVERTKEQILIDEVNEKLARMQRERDEATEADKREKYNEKVRKRAKN